MTNQTRLVHLRDNVGYINAGVLPDDVGCNILCLTDRQTSILRSMTFPYAYWATRVVNPSGGDVYWTNPAALAEIQETLEDLELQLGGGGVMGCESIAAALVDLAEAITTSGSGSGSGCVTNVSCGSGVLGPVGNALGGLTPEEITGGAQETPPDFGSPPDGFATWQEYEVYKCEAAHYIWQVFRDLATTSSLFATFPLSAAAYSGFMATFSIALAVEVAAVSVVGLVAIALALGALGVVVFTAFQQVVTYLDDNKSDIVCQLYASGSGAEALGVLQGAIENAVQGIVWAGVLSGLGVAASPLITSFLGAIATPDTVRPLFKLVVAISVPDADCTGCYQADLLLNEHFLDGLDNWESPDGNVTVLDSTRVRFDSNVAGNMNYIHQDVVLTETRTYFVGLQGNRSPTTTASVIEMVIDLDVVLTLPAGDADVHEELGAVYLAAGAHTVYVGVEEVGGYPAYDGAIDYASLR